MKHTPPLKINIPQPCNQVWAAMPDAGEGKHCSQCNNIVYDFSYMSDDDLLNFFKQHNGVPCGRFYNSQLHRDITHTVNRKQIFLSRFNKVAAAIFAVLSFKSMSSRAEIKSTGYETTFDSNYKYNSRDTGITTISGTIKEYNGGPLQNAKVMFESEQVAVTDKDGRFSFELKRPNLEIEEPNFTSRNLYFSYDSLITAVRTYHAAMFSANYNIVLYKPGTGLGFTMGAPMIEDVHLGDLPSITFKINSSKLTNEGKTLLGIIATKLKEKPGSNINIQAYPASRISQYLSKQRLENIKAYLTNIEGISSERIKITLEIAGGDRNIVDIKDVEN